MYTSSKPMWSWNNNENQFSLQNNSGICNFYIMYIVVVLVPFNVSLAGFKLLLRIPLRICSVLHTYFLYVSYVEVWCIKRSPLCSSVYFPRGSRSGNISMAVPSSCNQLVTSIWLFKCSGTSHLKEVYKVWNDLAKCFLKKLPCFWNTINCIIFIVSFTSCYTLFLPPINIL